MTEEKIDYIAERGLGPWIKRRREKKGMTLTELTEASSVPTRTIQRYEKDQGLGYETLRLLDALGVKWSDGPLRASPASINREVRDLRLAVEALAAGVPVEARTEISARLQSLEERVDQMAEETARSLEALLAGIARLEQRRPGSDDQGRATGTDG